MVRDCRKKRTVTKMGPGPDIGIRYRDRVPMRGRFSLMQSNCNQVAEISFGLDALDAGPGCAVTEEDQGWDACDAKVSDNLRLLVDIDKAKFDYFGQIIGQAIQPVEDSLAGGTPVRPEAEQHRFGGLCYLCGIILAGYGQKDLIHVHNGAFPFAGQRSGWPHYRGKICSGP